MTDVQPEDFGALEKAVNDTAGKASALWLSFIFFATLLIITVGSVTHRHLFLEQDLQVAVLNVKLPLVGFFFAAPLFFVVFHFYALLQLQGLATKIAAYNERLMQEVRISEDRRLIRLRLDPFVFVQMSAGARERRSGRIGSSNRLVAWITIVGLPLATLLLIQLTFLPYHHQLTWLHRSAVVTDLVLVWMFWHALAEETARPSGGTETDKNDRAMRPGLRVAVRIIGQQAAANLRRWRKFGWHTMAKMGAGSLKAHWLVGVAPSRAVAITASLCVGMFSVIAAYPTEMIYRWTKVLTAPVFEGSIDTVAGKPNTWFGLSNKLILPDQDFGVAERLKSLQDAGEPDRVTLSLRGRDLAGAVLARVVDLRQADFTGSVLSGASLRSARLAKARFECGIIDSRSETRIRRCAQLQGAVLDHAQLQGALLVRAQLQGASLAWGQLQGASLVQAQLQGVVATGAGLQGASLNYAQLQGAYLDQARLQGASLQGAELQGAILDGAELHGASLEHAQLQGASLRWAELEGALLVQTQLQGASLNGTTLKGALLDRISIYRLKCTFRERFHQCETLRAEIAKTHHRQFEFGRDLQLITPLGSEGRIEATSWRYEKFVMKLIDGLPTVASRNEVRARLSVLDPVGYSRAKDKEDVDAWATESAARSLPLREHKKARAKRLRDLACDHAAAPYVALGLFRNDARSIEASASSHLPLPDETVCPGTKGMTLRQLRSLAAWFEKLDRELAEPPPTDPAQSPPTADKG